jgi:hypothetical protein
VTSQNNPGSVSIYSHYSIETMEMKKTAVETVLLIDDAEEHKFLKINYVSSTVT